jgi:competence protein ComEA
LPEVTHTNGPIFCHVVGAVAKPGVYALPRHALVRDAVGAAGGLLPAADIKRINLAAEVQDHEQVQIPRIATPTAQSPPTSTPGPSAQPSPAQININTADSIALQQLPGIGPVLAQRIVDLRETQGPFSSVDQLINVKGIGDTTLERLRPLITVGP